MKDFITTLEAEFNLQANNVIAKQQEAYMRNRFITFGIKTETRRNIQKPFLVKAFLPPKQELESIIKSLWSKPQREFQYFGQELAFKYLKLIEENDIELFEYMVANKSWWDTVDFIAVKLMGAYFKAFPDNRKTYIDQWLASNNIWLQRSALLFQLKYKDAIDTTLLAYTINHLLGTKEFFINKAIGWILREYSRTNPKWVLEFVSLTNLSPLSKKEAVRLIK